MKLIIQIPCYNEEKTLPATIADLPAKIEGIDEIEYLVIDDGSSDSTVETAKRLGVHHVISFASNRGLARAFMAGIDACLHLGADIIVNTDGDNQYKGSDIEKLIGPVIENRADVAIGDRGTDTIEYFSDAKKFFQKVGSSVVRFASGSDVSDTTSGFRAYTREAAMRINVLSEYTYTLESIIQAGRSGMSMSSVEIGTNKKLRESRLFKSMYRYIGRSAATIIRTYSQLRPLKTFLTIGLLFFILGIIPGARFLYFWIKGDGDGHVQSLILSQILIGIGFQTVIFALLADSIYMLRKLSEEQLYRIRKVEYSHIQDECEKAGPYRVYSSIDVNKKKRRKEN